MTQDNSHLFTVSMVDWFRNDAYEVLRNIADATFNNADIGAEDMFRPPLVPHPLRGEPDYIPAAAERLVRWDLRHPNVIFHDGFVPQAPPAPGTFPADSFNLGQYVSENVHSIFVGTARYRRNDEGKVGRWAPRVTKKNRHRFEYEIFAYGGIDVNHCMGTDHAFANQHEIAFPGGIKPQLIRTAREYEGSELVRLWDNNTFNRTANGPGQTPEEGELPDIIRRKPVPVMLFTERDGISEASTGIERHEIMVGDGGMVEDEY